jgi:hypothetical protein
MSKYLLDWRFLLAMLAVFALSAVSGFVARRLK